MKKKELLESTKIYTADHQKLNFKKDIPKFPNLADVLDTAKDCILTGKEYSIFRNSDYDPKYIISKFITAFDNDYKLRANPYLLEYKLTPFSSFLIFHIADMRVNNIATEFVNPDCVYSCYLYIPTDTEREQAVIVLNTSENNSENLKNIIMHIRSNEYDISSDMGDFDLNRLNSILTLCTNSLEKAPSPQMYMHKANFNSYKQNLTFKEYIIDYSKKLTEVYMRKV